MGKIYQLGVFTDEQKFISSLEELRHKSISVYEVFTPYPVHEVFHLLERKSKLPFAAYFFGLFGVVATVAFLYYTSVIDWPIVYGGKPFNSFPSFVVVTIVVTIFTVTILSLGLFSARSKLFPGKENTVFHPEATDDKFVIVVEGKAEEAVRIMKDGGALEIKVSEFENVIV
jgi:hypothetical protein